MRKYSKTVKRLVMRTGVRDERPNMGSEAESKKRLCQTKRAATTLKRDSQAADWDGVFYVDERGFIRSNEI